MTHFKKVWVTVACRHVALCSLCSLYMDSEVKMILVLWCYVVCLLMAASHVPLRARESSLVLLCHLQSFTSYTVWQKATQCQGRESLCFLQLLQLQTYYSLSVWQQRSTHVTQWSCVDLKDMLLSEMCDRSRRMQPQLGVATSGLLNMYKLFLGLHMIVFTLVKDLLSSACCTRQEWDGRVFQSELCMRWLFMLLWEELLLIVHCLVKTESPLSFVSPLPISLISATACVYTVV